VIKRQRERLVREWTAGDLDRPGRFPARARARGAHGLARARPGGVSAPPVRV